MNLLMTTAAAALEPKEEVCKPVDLEKIVFSMEPENENSCYKILFFKQGSGVHKIGASQYAVKPYTIHLVVKEQEHSLEKAVLISGYCLLVPDIYFWNYLPENYLNILTSGNPLNNMAIVKLNQPDFKIISGILHNIKQYCNPALSEHSLDMAGNYLNILFSYIYLCYLQKYKNPTDNHFNKLNRIIRNYLQLVDKHFINHYSVQQYAEILCTAPNYLNELCKKELGITAQLVVKNKLIAGAKQMLLHSDKGIKEIAYELGFCNPSHFTLFFKKHTSFLPSAYQKASL